MTGNPMVTLNRAVALAMVDGPDAGLALLATLDDRLAGHHRLAAVRGHLLERAGRPQEAADQLLAGVARDHEPRRARLPPRAGGAAATRADTLSRVTVDPHILLSPAVTNLRDVGGRATADGGTVATGVAYRSAELADDSVATDAALADLGIRTVVDLRTDAERSGRPDQLPAGAQLRGARRARGHAGAGRPRSCRRCSPAATPTVAGGPRPGRADAHRLPPARRRRTRPGRRTRRSCGPSSTPSGRPVLFHCTAGKDRTGWAATILLLAAGVDEAGATGGVPRGEPGGPGRRSRRCWSSSPRWAGTRSCCGRCSRSARSTCRRR